MKKLIFIALVVAALTAAAHADLLSHWKLDESDGIIAHDSMGHFNGNITGAAWTTGGKINGALSFDAYGDYVSIPGLIPGNQGTFAAWVKSDVDINSSSPQRYNSLLYSYRSQIFLGSPVAGHQGQVRFVISPSYGVYSILHSNKDSWNADQWYHIACTWDGNTQAVYVDGLLDKSQIQTENGGWGATYIGGVAENLSYSFDGVIDDVHLYDRALSQSEIKAIIPEPATFLLLGLGSLALLRKRRV